MMMLPVLLGLKIHMEEEKVSMVAQNMIVYVLDVGSFLHGEALQCS